MLVICEDCAKKYNIDETKIKGDKAKFNCNECGHIIVVQKPVADPAQQTESKPELQSESTAAGNQISDEEAMQQLADMDSPTSSSAPVASSSRSAGKGMPVSFYFSLTMLTGFLMICGAFAYLYLTFIPGIINNQIELRTVAIAKTFSGIVENPLVLRHYLEVNKEAQRISKIPGVAYASVVNSKGIVIAGFFGDITKFDGQFVQRVKKKGFPKDVLDQNVLASGMDQQSSRIMVGGQKIVDQVIAISDTGAQAHVGVFVSEVDNAIRQALLSPLTLSIFGGLVVVGIIMLLLLTKLIAKPLQDLTNVAHRISLGQLDLTVEHRGPREMRELATAFERMQHSIKTALDRLKK
jgi:HAMP domain-containing protein